MPETMKPDTMVLDTGEGQLRLILPAGFDVEVLQPKAMPAAADALVEIQRALTGPIGAPRLSRMARAGMKVALIVCDDTRYAPQKLIIPAIAAELQSAGVLRSDITIIIACGTHEAMGKEAIVHMLGPEIPQAYRVVNHDAYDEAGLVRVGVSKGLGVPIVLNRMAVEADLRIGIGAVDPHIFLRYHASDADYRKSTDYTESPKHYIDIDKYNDFITKGRIPQTLDSVNTIYGSAFVIDNGILPWATKASFDSLRNCMQRHDFDKAQVFAADLGGGEAFSGAIPPTDD